MSRHKLLFPTKQNYKVSSKVAFACACVMYTKGLYSNPLGNAVSHSTDSYSHPSPNMIVVVRKKIMLAENHVMQKLYEKLSIA